MAETVHVRVPDGDVPLLEKLAAATGRGKATLAAFALSMFVRDPRVHSVQQLENDELRTYMLKNPATIELIAVGMAKKLTDTEWRVLITRLSAVPR